ncbi:MAG: hypothetical protein K8F91_08010 [Candidatus Obscuribacterales bacterium]|nr:hypothetical protein [Candidatus Obscuribacterales bacterium]
MAIKYTITISLVFLLTFGLSACGDSSWETIKPQGTKTSFELPKPVGHPPRDGYEMYEAKTGNGDNKIQIGIFQRKNNLTDVIPEGTPDADALQLFEKHSLEQLETNLLKDGLSHRLVFDKDLGVENGLGQQYKLIVSDKFTLNQFYLTPEQLLWVKIDNSDESDPVVARFLESLVP